MALCSQSAALPEWAAVEPAFAELARTGNPQLRESLTIAYLPLAERLARRYAGRGQSREELVQVACLGLVLALDRFDLTHGATFPAYATVTVLGELRRHFRDRAWAVRPPRRLQDLGRELAQHVAELAQELGRQPSLQEIAEVAGLGVAETAEAMEAASAYRSASLDAPIGGPDNADFTLGSLVVDDGDTFALVDDIQSLRGLVRQLPERERRLLGLRFFVGWSQDRIAADLGISQMHVSRLLSRTLDQLHDALVAGPEGAATVSDGEGARRVAADLRV